MVVRYDENPFLVDVTIKRKSKQVRISSLGSNNHVLVDQSTGEMSGTHIATYKSVDQEEFVKLFTQNIALTFDLTSAGIKVFNVLMYAVQKQAIERDLIALDKYVLEDFLETHKLKLSLPTFSRGLTELVNSKIIARHKRQGFFFINPSFVFNGDRIAFTTVIQRKGEREKGVENQSELDI